MTASNKNVNVDNIENDNDNQVKEQNLESASIESNDEEQNIENEQLIKLEDEVANLKDQLIRQIADNDNDRKRFSKQLEDAHKFAITNFVKDLLPVMDNMHRALEHAPKEIDLPEEIVNLLKGIELTKDELGAIFNKYNIVLISPQPGDKFDYNQHQAVANIANEEFTAGQIIDVIQAGYSLENRLIRPAMVSVAK